MQPIPDHRILPEPTAKTSRDAERAVEETLNLKGQRDLLKLQNTSLAQQLFASQFALRAILQILRDASFVDIKSKVRYDNTKSLVQALVAEETKSEDIRIKPSNAKA